MYFDHLAEERQDRIFELWLHTFLQREPEHLSMHLAKKHRHGKTLAACLWKNDAFNVCYRVKYEDGTCWAGPYIVMEFVEGDIPSNILKDPLKKEGRPVLNPRISDRALKIAYREMAYLVLELSKPQFAQIGALVQEGKEFVVGKRPFTFNMNELVTSANLGPADLPTSTFESAADYFAALAEQQLSHLRHQRNDAVTDEADCQKKFVARCLFRKIARDISVEHRQGPYRLYCDDFFDRQIFLSTWKSFVSTR